MVNRDDDKANKKKLKSGVGTYPARTEEGGG
jgi:hypothetical protein